MNSDSRNRETRRLAALQRDATLARIGRTRRWLIAGAATLTAGFAALVSSVTPHKAVARLRTQPSSTASTSRATGPAPKLPPLASAGALGLRAPSAPPAGAAAPTPSASAGSGNQSAASPVPSDSQAAPAPVAPAPAPVAPAPVVTSGGS